MTESRRDHTIVVPDVAGKGDVIKNDYKAAAPTFPATRYQGSKQKILSWVGGILSKHSFTSFLEPFGGTGCVSYWAKTQGKAVAYNDILRANCLMAAALIENDSITLSESEAETLLQRKPLTEYDRFIEETFPDVYFTDDENKILDIATQNISRMKNRSKQNIAWYALFQSCIAKRPYNLFHRKNLYMRLQSVRRTFGNKTTWDRPLEKHFLNFVSQANSAVFRGRHPATVTNRDAMAIAEPFDMAYVDPPYSNGTGVAVDYFGFYHFLEGLADYSNWKARIDYSKKHRPLLGGTNGWTSGAGIRSMLAQYIPMVRTKTLALSYRSDGQPSIDELLEFVGKSFSKVELHRFGNYKYVLSTNCSTEEILIVGTNPQ